MNSIVELESIGLHDLVHYNTFAWSGDDEFHQYMHIPGASIAEYVEDNLNAIYDAATTYQVECYKVVANSRDVGFTVLLTTAEDADPVLFSFGIRKEERTKDVLTGWLSAVENAVGSKAFFVSLYKVNSRAIDFFERNGFDERKELKQNIFLLWQSMQQ